MNETPVCVLCGSPDRDKRSDHLREVWWSKAQERLHPSYFMPLLTYDEKYILRQGENRVCSSRGACRRRQKVRSKGGTMKLPSTKCDELWLKALVKVAIEEAEMTGVWRRDELLQFVLFWVDELAEVLWT